METKDNTDIELLYRKIFMLPINSSEYRKCIEKIRFSETDGHTLGLNLNLEPVTSINGCVDINISKAL